MDVLERAAQHGIAALAIDQPGSIAQLALVVARQRQVPVAYIPGLVMRRAADLYPGEVKTDRRDAYLIAATARTRRKQVHWLDAESEDLLERLRVLNGFDIDLAADQTRLTNRLRDALSSVSPALVRAGRRFSGGPCRRPGPFSTSPRTCHRGTGGGDARPGTCAQNQAPADANTTPPHPTTPDPDEKPLASPHNSTREPKTRAPTTNYSARS